MIKIESKAPSLSSCSAKKILEMYDYAPAGTISFIASKPDFPSDFSVGLIVGPSGSGKSVLLSTLFGGSQTPVWNDDVSVIDHFGADGIDRLCGAGLRSVPDWCKSYRMLSTGAKHRADVARLLQSQSCIDEFTSTVDRNTAKSIASSARAFAKRNELSRVVFASCHYDIAEWLMPDWLFDTGVWRFKDSRCLRRPRVVIDIVPCDPKEFWPMFSKHHYLSASINKSANCWVGIVDGAVVAFTSVIAFPNANFKSAWREHRTVVLPEFQGMGIGSAIVESVAELITSSGSRFFSKTAHPAFGEYRNKSPKWRATSKNGMKRHDYATTKTKTKEDSHKMNHAHRVTYSHEYIGG